MKIHIHEGGVDGGMGLDGDGFGSYETSQTTRGESEVTYREGPTEVEIEMPLVCAKEDDLDVTVRGRTLTVRTEREVETRTAAAGGERVEKKRNVWTKEVEIPVAVDPTRADALLEGGLLLIRIPRRL